MTEVQNDEVRGHGWFAFSVTDFGSNDNENNTERTYQHTGFTHLNTLPLKKFKAHCLGSEEYKYYF